MKPVIEIKNLTKLFNQKCVFSNLDMKIYENEILVIMGASGSGKSTLLNILSQIDMDFEGEILYDESLFENVKIPFPMIFQESESLLPWLTVEENIKLIHQKVSQIALEEVLEKVDLVEHRHKKPRELSGGMKQRVGIARAMLCNSKIMLMDEPFASLDKDLRVKMQDLVLQIQKEQKLSIVFVTHDEKEADVMSHRVIRLD
ncbi:ABC transporter ATP-binding protein [Fusibacter bizertensis]